MGALGPELRYLIRPGFWRRLWNAVRADNVSGIAAEVSYYVLFAMFPFLLFVAAMARLLGPEPEIAMARLFSLLHRFLPTSTAAVLTGFLEGPIRANAPYLISVGILGILWAGSQGFAAVLNALNRIYCVRESRSWIRRRALAVAMMVLAALGSLLVLVLMDPAGLPSSRIALPPPMLVVWSWLRWPALFAILAIVLGWLYTNVPCTGRRREWVTPGSLIASLFWLGASAVLAAYIDTRANAYAQLYGAVGDVIILMLWIYVGVFVILLGAEINMGVLRGA